MSFDTRALGGQARARARTRQGDRTCAHISFVEMSCSLTVLVRPEMGKEGNVGGVEGKGGVGRSGDDRPRAEKEGLGWEAVGAAPKAGRVSADKIHPISCAVTVNRSSSSLSCSLRSVGLRHWCVVSRVLGVCPFLCCRDSAFGVPDWCEERVRGSEGKG